MFQRLKAPVELEEEVLAFWKERDIFAASMRQSEGRPPFVFFEGPPTANGLPHNGHVLTRVMKDVVPRYRTLRGHHVQRKAGWDTHGLPVEVEVEKALGVHGREAIEAYGLDAFARKCRESVFVYVQEWEELTRQIGFWVDLDAPYVTFHREYVESVWWALSRLFSKGLLYQGHKVVWWWPQGGTTLSAGEVGQGYKDVDDPSATVLLEDVDDPGLCYLAWTTTPWTLPSNVALAVGPRVTYVVYRLAQGPFAGKRVVLAEARVGAYAKELEGAELLGTKTAADLVGRRYRPLFRVGLADGEDAEARFGGRLWVIVAGDHVTIDAGTGIVHTAPAFGVDDMDVAKAQGLGVLQWIEPDGTFSKVTADRPETAYLAGRFCKEADSDILRDLRERGLLFQRGTIRHPYPFCWRADDEPLIQYARPAWFIRTTARNKEALANNAAVSWQPEHIQEGRFGDFLRNNVDWALSRERFWGTPLNIWTCEGCEDRVAPASCAEIERRGGVFDPEVDAHLQVHRPWLDRVTLRCEKCGGTMKRVPEVIDCWFDSGAMPFAQWGFPHRGKEQFQAQFPADYICEAVDQTRGWFYSLLMISTLLFDEETCTELGLQSYGFPRPFKNCVVLGHICDMDGKKESKSKGNYTSPNLVLRGVCKLTALPDPSLTAGSVGLKRDQVRSLDVGDERVALSATRDGERRPAKVVEAAVKPKDTVHLHPEDLRALGLPEKGGPVWFRVPGEAPGADAFRWLFCAASPPWSNTRLSMRAIRELAREFLLRLRNVYQFFSIYADIAVEKGTFHPARVAPRPLSSRSTLDRWILHQLEATKVIVTENLDEHRVYEGARALSTFVDDLSNWYVRRSRARFWNEGPDSEDALWTLYEALVELAILMSPFVPFLSEALWQALVAGPLGKEAPASVHLGSWPAPAPERRNDALAADMALVRELASLGLAARAASKIKVRQPLAAVSVVLSDASRRAALEPYLEVLAEELNVREVRFAADAGTYVKFKVKPDFKKLGAKLGKDMKAVQGALSSMDPAAVKAALDAGGLEVTAGDRQVTLSAEEVVVSVEPQGGYEAASSAAGVVALHTALTDDLRDEGLVRELVNRVQGLRKEMDLGYSQRIELAIESDPGLTQALRRFGDYLQRETLTTQLREGLPSGVDGVRDWDVEGHVVRAWATAV